MNNVKEEEISNIKEEDGSPIELVFKQAEELATKIKKESDELRSAIKSIDFNLGDLAKKAGISFKSRYKISGGNLGIEKLSSGWGIIIIPESDGEPRYIFDEGRDALIEFVEIFPQFLANYSEELKIYEIEICKISLKAEKISKSIVEEKPKNISKVEEGIPIFGRFDGKIYNAIYYSERKIIYDGKTYGSPSEACRAIVSWLTCNGWEFWKFEKNGKEYLLDALRS